MQINQVAHFSTAPNVQIERSKFNLSRSHKTTADAGLLYPFYHLEILPGDTISMDLSVLARMSTPLFPVMDNAYLDTFFFYVPNRLVWSHWKEFCGENNTSAWDDGKEYFVPTVASGNAGFTSGSIADHFGIPINVPDIAIDTMPFRAYRLIWNEWFRNQNLQDPKLVNLGDSQSDRSVAADRPLPVNRFRDYFSSALPAPQKGAAVQIPLDGSVPVTPLNDEWFDPSLGDFKDATSVLWRTTSTALGLNDDYYRYVIQLRNNPYEDFVGGRGSMSQDPETIGGSSPLEVVPTNLFARYDLGSGYATVNALRQAFQIQRILEKDARSGTRYAELLRSHFGVVVPDASLQRPEYLGGKRISLSMQQVVQTSANGNDQVLGGTGAVSKTVDGGHMFSKSFTEHGRIIGVFCIRTDRSYQQGIPREFSRRTRFDYYWPSLAHLGEQAVKNKEIYALGSGSDSDLKDDEIFGYQEAWAEYRSDHNQVTGGFRKNYVGGEGLNAWHYADWYESRPFLSNSWDQEGAANVARTLSQDTSYIDSQFYLDCYCNVVAARPMPLYSIPGLIDHF